MPQIQMLEPGRPGIGSTVGQALGGGLSQGLSARLNQMLEKKRNTSSATALADSLGLKDEAKQSFIGTFSNVSADKQLKALNDLAQAQLYMGYGAGLPGGSQGQGEIPQGQPQAAPQSQNIAGFDFTPDELGSIRSEPTIPPVGPLETKAKMQHEDRKENRKEIAAYAEKAGDVTELQSIARDLEEAKKLIDNGALDSSFIRTAATAILEGRESQFAELTKTADQQKLFTLFRRSLKPKDIGGSNPSTREVLIALQAIPTYLTKPEAAKFMADRMLRIANQDLDKARLIQNLRKVNPMADPSSFKELVERKVSDKYKSGSPNEGGKVRIRTSDGRVGTISREKLQEAQKRDPELEVLE